MLTIGLTGGIACGKSTAAQYFKELGIPVIDADVIALELTATHPEIAKKIIGHFGNAVLDDKNNLQRKKLREIIFADEAERLWLEQLLHPLILNKMQQETQQLSTPYCIWVVPLLIEKNIKVDRILVIDCPADLQIKRLQQRDQMSAEQITAALKIQVSREQRLAKADAIITNVGDKEELKKQVMQLHHAWIHKK